MKICQAKIYSLFKIFIVAVVFCVGPMPKAKADVYINLMAVNGAPKKKDTTVKFNLPPELKKEDVIDADGLELDYDVNLGGYYAHGKVSLESKESKKFRLRVKDVWKITPETVASIKKQIDEGFDSLGKARDPQKGEQLKQQLISQLDAIVDQQNSKGESVERRMDTFRLYTKKLRDIQKDSMAVEYWRSELGEQREQKLVYMTIEVENLPSNPKKVVKIKSLLPSEVKPEHVIDPQGFEVRYNEQKQEAFLYKEEEMAPGEKKKFTVGIEDIWTIPQKDIDYLRQRANYAYDFLKESRFAASSKLLFDRLIQHLSDIEASQQQKRQIKEHISAFRDNKELLINARVDVEALENILAVYREDLEKSKVKNVLQKVKSLNSLSEVSKSIFDKKPTMDNTWKLILGVVGFVALLTFLNFVLSSFRSGKDNIQQAKKSAQQQQDKDKA